MGRDRSDEDLPAERDRAKRHKKERRHSPERSRVRHENGHERGRREERRKNATEESRRDDHKSRHRSRDREREPKKRKERDRERHEERPEKRDRGERSPRSEDAHRSKKPHVEPTAPAPPQDASALDDEAAKRRQRVQLWQEQRRAAQAAEEAEARRREAAAEAWTLDDDTEQEAGLAGEAAAAEDLAEGSGEVDPLDAFMAENDRTLEDTTPAAAAVAAAAAAEEEVDPLDAFMAAEVAPAVRRDLAAAGGRDARDAVGGARAPGADAAAQVKVEDAEDAKPAAPVPQGQRRLQKPVRRRRHLQYESDSSGDVEEESDDSDDEEWIKNVTAGKLSKSDKLGQVDHSAIEYPPFRRSFYMEPQELARQSEKQVAEARRQLDDVKVRGLDVPKPVRNWNQCGLSSRVLDVLRKAGFESPMPIQAQALPVIMSGRDCIGIAKTGSGKTLAFVLPMMRHIKAQRPLESGDGPVGLVMAPTRELVVQIGRDVKKFARVEGLTCVTVYGGSGVANQITELKRGTEVVVCTPGRMIDILVTSGGKITNLRRVTYLVMDEADRMFDMGFEPQITRIVNNIRPDRQTVMFSATFPRSVEVLAKRVLQAPVEIQVGGRSVVNSDITQFVEIRAPEDRFMRLLELLGEWQEQGKVLVFVNSQEQCDKLFRDLLQVSYACLSLHGGKDQSDRESTVHDFKTDVCNLLIATSVAARGLDVRDLVVVINYDPPNHHEDYVHRVGRTGRAGRKGTAYTFICEEEERFAPDLVKALQESGAAVPRDLLEIAEAFAGKRKRGEAQAHGSGFRGSGYKFDSKEEDLRNAERKAAVREARRANGEYDSDEEGGGGGGVKVPEEKITAVTGEPPPGPRPELGQPQVSFADNPDLAPEVRELQARAKKLAEGMARAPGAWASGAAAAQQPAHTQIQPAPAQPGGPSMLVRAAQAAAQRLAVLHGIPLSAPPQPAAHKPLVPEALRFESEIEINDFPQHARWKITHRETIRELAERTGAAVTTKGLFCAPGQTLPEGERRIYLHIEGPSEAHVRECRREVKRILEESTERAMRRDGPAGHKYVI